MKRLIYAFLIFVSTCTHYIRATELVIETTYGKVQGKTIKSLGREVDAWYGIPYAKPPLNDLRFRPPVPLDPWSDVLDTTTLPPSCMQTVDAVFGDFPGAKMWTPNTNISEDCLYLNVVVPHPRPKKATVMVWIYGGGFSTGSSTLDLYDPKILVSEEDIVFVSMQYRLNIFGFLYFGIEKAPGNAGLFDQLLALQWIKSNIANFGGNPDDVTIFGESAGAGAASILSLSPLAKNLFKRAIMQSGSVLADWAVMPNEEIKERGYIAAKEVNCTFDSIELEAIVDCLRKADSKALAKAEWAVPLTGFVQFAFLPVIDHKLLPKHPDILLKEGEMNNVDILLGANENEGMYFIFYVLRDALNPTRAKMSRNEFINHTSTFRKHPLLFEAILFEYTNWIDPHDNFATIRQLDKLIGDHFFTCPVDGLAKYYADHKRNVFLYYYKYVNDYHYWPLWGGSLHADEIEFIFGRPLDGKKPYSHEQIKFSKQMMRYWTNFAKTGNPNGHSHNDSLPIWPLHESKDRAYINLDLGNISISKGGLRPRQCYFLQKYLPNILRLKCNEI